MIVPQENSVYKGINNLSPKGDVVHVAAPEFFKPIDHEVPLYMSEGRLLPADCIFKPGSLGLQFQKQILG